MLSFQRLPSRRWRFDTTGEPLLIVPDYDGWLTHYWAMQEDGVAVRVDSVAALDLTPTASITRVAGKEAFAVPQVVAGDYLSATGGAALNGSVLLSCWFNLDFVAAIGANQGVVSLHPTNMLLAVQNSTLFYPRLVVDALVVVTGAVAIADDAVHHMVAFAKTGVQHLACDGVFAGSGSESVTFIAPEVSTKADAITPEVFGSQGWLDEVAVWEGLDFVSPDDFMRLATALYNSGGGVFYDGADWYEVA